MDKKIYTANNAFHNLANKVIFVETSEKSKLIQEKLFECGFGWTICGKRVAYIYEPFLLTDASGVITFAESLQVIEDLVRTMTRISADEVINISIIKEDTPKFHRNERVVFDDGIAGIIAHIYDDNHTYSISVGHCELFERDESKIQLFSSAKKIEPFTKILYKYANNGEWMPGFFSHYNTTAPTDYPFYIIGVNSPTAYCIPYAGNEDLLNK